MARKKLFLVVFGLIVPAALSAQSPLHLWVGPRGGMASYSGGGESDSRVIFGGEAVLSVMLLPIELQVSADYFTKSEAGGDSKGLLVDVSGKYKVLPTPLLGIHLGLGGGMHSLSGEVYPAGQEEEGSFPDFHAFLGVGLRFSKLGVFVEPKYSRVFTDEGANVLSASAGIIYKLF